MKTPLATITVLYLALSTQNLFSQQTSIYSKLVLLPAPDCWVIGPFPEGISENEIRDDVTELIKTDPIYSKQNQDSLIQMRLRILLVREFEEFCSPMKISWSLGIAWTKDGDSLPTYPNAGNMILNKFVNHAGIGSAQIIRKRILQQIQRHFLPEWRSTVNVDSLPRINALPSSIVNIEDPHGIIVQGGWREIPTPPTACIPPSTQYPPLARIAGIQGQAEVDVIVDENGNPYRALGVAGTPQLLRAAGDWVLGWKFDMSGRTLEKTKWYRFKVTVTFLLEEASTPGPILQRPGCVVGRKRKPEPVTVY